MPKSNQDQDQLESSIENSFCDWLELQFPKWHAYKLKTLNNSGWPDRLILGPHAVIFFIEFKRPGEKPEPLQKHIHKLLRKLGFKVYVCTTVKSAKEKIIQRIV